MEKRDYYIILYDLYCELFTERQRDVFELYYFNNLSLSEISDNCGVSRNAIHKCIKNVETKLLYYEEKLGLYKKNNKINNIIRSIDNEKIKEQLEGLL